MVFGAESGGKTEPRWVPIEWKSDVDGAEALTCVCDGWRERAPADVVAPGADAPSYALSPLAGLGAGAGK